MPTFQTYLWGRWLRSLGLYQAKSFALSTDTALCRPKTLNLQQVMRILLGH